MENPTMFVSTGDPTTVNDATIKTGQLGKTYTDPQSGVKYKYVQTDSTPSSLTQPADQSAAYWKDRSNNLVTSDVAQAPEARNGVAGIFTKAVTAGNGCFIIIDGLKTIKAGATVAAGQAVFANSGANGDFIGIAVGTAPTYTQIGVWRAADSGGVATAMVSIPRDRWE